MANEDPPSPHQATTVFISYTQDPIYPPPPEPENAAKEREIHRHAIRRLAEYLTHLGVKCTYDQLFEADPPDYWPLWVEQQVKESNYVLMVCSSSYCYYLTNRNPERVLGYSDRPLSEEGRVTYSLMMKNLRKFIPVFVNQPRCRDFVPIALQGSSIYELCEPFCLNDDKHGPMEMLYARLTSQNPYKPPAVGRVQKLTAPKLGGVVRLSNARSAPSARQAPTVSRPLEQPSHASTNQPAMRQPECQANAKQYDVEVDDDLLTFLSPHIGYWKMLARNLGFSEGGIDNLEYDFKRQEEQGIQMLHIWKKDNGDDAKISVLVNAALKADRRHIITLIDEYLKNKQ